ncbi:MAG: hypothetical protein HUU28_12575 [Planctomycetaceae bacterium]|nr:hypothetical protein [Planctomycetaceae bacterium]
MVIACAASRPEQQPVTAKEKQELIQLIMEAPTQGEFLAEEGVEQLAPHIRTLFALTSADVDKEHIYPFVALSYGLCQQESGWRYGVEHFDEIQHPLLQLFWGALLFKQDHASPAIVDYLQRILDTPELRNELEPIVGPEFPSFEQRVRTAPRT